MTTQPPCVVCQCPGIVNTKASNALPAGVCICAACRSAIARREVGIVLYVTDARKADPFQHLDAITQFVCGAKA